MAHAFDTGLPLAQRTTLRNGAVTLLAGLRLPAGYLEAVIPWGGIIRGYTDLDGIDLLLQDLNGRAPSIAVALGDRQSKPAGMGGFTFKGGVELVLYFYSSHHRDNTEGRVAIDAVGLANDHADPGLDVIMEHAEELMVGQYPGAVISVKQCVPILEEELQTRDEFTLWKQTYAVQVDRVINSNRNVTQLLVSFYSSIRTSDPEMLAPAAPVVAELTVPTTAGHGGYLGSYAGRYLGSYVGA